MFYPTNLGSNFLSITTSLSLINGSQEVVFCVFFPFFKICYFLVWRFFDKISALVFLYDFVFEDFPKLVFFVRIFFLSFQNWYFFLVIFRVCFLAVFRDNLETRFTFIAGSTSLVCFFGCLKKTV